MYQGLINNLSGCKANGSIAKEMYLKQTNKTDAEHLKCNHKVS